MGEAGRQGQRERTGKKTLEKLAAISAQPQIESSAIDSKRLDRKTQPTKKHTPDPSSQLHNLNWEK